MSDEETMVDRVARAIAETLMEIDQKRAENSGHDIMLVIDAYLPPCRIAARAAIEAMREPTEAMGDAADDPVHKSLKEQGQFSIEKYGKLAFASYPFSMAVWQAMIDAALKEHEGEKAG